MIMIYTYTQRVYILLCILAAASSSYFFKILKAAASLVPLFVAARSAAKLALKESAAIYTPLSVTEKLT